ncbi:sulfate ABC transporter substrate-binding protein [Neisseria chenwenguii]|uniref:sulfate ABC transporter substrate-binding protein n=1 Tax=Neisseria chenwenguii TaxID=1853278 RepID=UPI00398942B0
MKQMRPLCYLAAALVLATAACSDGQGAGSDGEYKKILNVSYDVSRDFYKEYNELFIKEYQKSHPKTDLYVQQSHGGSSKQAMSVINGLPADVVTMNQVSDIDNLAQRGLVKTDWAERFPNRAVPFTSVTVMLVRKGNPKRIKDWNDLVRPDTKAVFANPKTSGNGRYALLSIYGYGLKASGGDKAAAEKFTGGVLKNVPMFENGSRAASTSFTRRNIGDVLVAPENEASVISKKLEPGKFEIVYPSYTAALDSPVAVVETVAEKKDSAQIAQDYLTYLWSKPAQELAAKLYFRPSDKDVLTKHRAAFPETETFRPDETLGTWPEIMKTFFADGALFDRLTAGKQPQ